MHLIKIKTITIIVLFFSVVVIYIFLNLGNFIDITEKAKKADIVVSLGGDDFGCRLKKAILIYESNISKSGIFIYTGTDYANHIFKDTNSRKQHLLNQNIEDKNIFHISKKLITNTMEEVLFIKKYMLRNNYKSVVFVSHPHHSRRIKILANLIAEYKDAGLSLSVVSCNPNWWDKNTYYSNKTSFVATIYEIVKLFYNLIKYNPLLIDYTGYKKNNKDILWDSAI